MVYRRCGKTCSDTGLGEPWVRPRRTRSQLHRACVVTVPSTQSRRLMFGRLTMRLHESHVLGIVWVAQRSAALIQVN